MHRNSLIETAGRVMHQAVRFTLNQGNDNPMMQELHLDGMNSEFRSVVERVQAFGFTSTPLPRDQQQQGQQSQSGGSGGIEGTEQPKGPAAEGICIFLGGQRNHPVCIAVDDRRHRPMGLKPGENAQYDDIGQMTLVRRIGTYILSLDSPDPSQQQSGASAGQHDSGGQGQNVERMVSIRHVEKQKQKRGTVGSGGSSSGGASAGTQDASSGASGAQSQQDYKHEGDTVNNEMRVTKKRIEFRSGDTVVGYYDKASATWCFIGKVKLGTENAQDPVYGAHGGVGNITDSGGSDAVFVNAPKPGPPTALDTEP